MASNMAEPSPSRNPREKLNARGGKSNTAPALKWGNPQTSTTAMVRITPAHKATMSFATDSILR